MNILAFDLGGSGGKLFLATINGENVSIRNIHRFENVSYSLNGALFWDIIQIYKEMNLGIQKAIALTNDQIDSFAIDSFSNDFALIDEQGTLLTPVRCYRDGRTERHAESIYNKISREKLYQLSGNQNALFNTFMQLAAMREDGHGFLLDHAHKLLFIPDLFLYYLTGKMISEYTISSVSQMYDFSREDWCQEILDTYQIPRRLFATLTKPGTLLGYTQESYNRMIGTKGFPVCAVCEHDTASAFLASPLSGDRALISCGTWALIGTELKHAVITGQGYLANLANEGGYPGRHRLLRNVMSSWLIQETRRYYKEHGKDYSFYELETLAGQAEPFQFLFNPDDPRFYTPDNIPVKIREYCQEKYGRYPDTIGSLTRSIYESLAMKFYWAVEQLEIVSGKQLPLINIMGGGSKSEMLCQFTANASGKSVIAGPEEATALGSIAVQLIAIGAASDLEHAKSLLSPSFHTREYRPEQTGIWAEKYRDFVKLLND